MLGSGRRRSTQVNSNMFRNNDLRFVPACINICYLREGHKSAEYRLPGNQFRSTEGSSR